MSQMARRWLIGILLIALAPTPAGFAQSLATISRVEFQGYRRVRGETLRALIFTRPGDPFCDKCLEGDLQALQRDRDFESVRLEVRDDPDRENAKVVAFYFIERPVIRRIDYRGLKSVTQSDVQALFKERNVHLSLEGLFDPTEANKAGVAIQELLAKHGHSASTVTPAYEQIPGTNAVGIVFTIDEGPSSPN